MMGVAKIEITHLIIAIAAFGLTLGIWLAILIVWRIRKNRDTERVEERLGVIQCDDSDNKRVIRLWHDSKEATLLVPKAPKKVNFLKQLDDLVKEAGWKIPVAVLLPAVIASSVLICVFIFAITGHPLASLAGLIATLIIAWAHLKKAVSKQRECFDQQFTDALDLACRSLRAGHPLMGAFQLVAEEIDAPVGPLFDKICQQQMMGLSLEEAIVAVSRTSSCEDMKLFAASLSMQVRSGGNLAQMMERLALVIRDRMRLGRRVRVLTAQTQFGKRILIALPFVLMVVLSIVNPKYIEPLYSTTTGQIMLAVGGCSVLLGMWSMNKIAVLKY